jgi:multisubunit Na+/H+ antiporter MnhF subunit
MIHLAIIILSICILLMLVNLLLSKNLPERVMSFSCVSNYVIVLLCFLSLTEGRDSFVDIAYIYALIGFIFNLSIKKLYNGNKNDQ